MTENDNRAFILEFIECYRRLPALWDTNNPGYSNRIIRDKQNQQLLEKYQQRYPNASRKDVCKKINNLRSNYRREIKRMKEGVEDGIHSTLYYFDAISFIDDIETRSSSRATFQEDNEPLIKKMRNDSTETEELDRLAIDDYVRKPHDASSSITNAWAERLSEMDREQRILAEKLMSDVVFNGQLGLLDYTTYLSNLRTLPRLSTPATRSNSANFVSESSVDSLHFK